MLFQLFYYRLETGLLQVNFSGNRCLLTKLLKVSNYIFVGNITGIVIFFSNFCYLLFGE